MKVSVIDHGLGNLHSVVHALAHSGADVSVVDTADGVAAAGRLVLPGVGAFAVGMAGLRERGLDEAVLRHAQAGRPLLGICLGMQMLASVGEEFGDHAGLGLVPGRVQAIPRRDAAQRPLRTPSTGWFEVQPDRPQAWAGSPLDAVPAGTAAYFVHSFHLVPDDPAHGLAHYGRGGQRIVAAVQAGPVLGCQFHPEKSGPAGLAILARFLAA